MSAPAIEARRVFKRFGRADALAGLDLTLDAGASLALLGPNGAGKSTLLRLVAGLARPTSGELRVGGERADGRAARARVGLIGDRTFLYPELTARENLVFAGRLHGVSDPRERAEALLAEEELQRVADRAAGAFSRGMAQRLAIARGLVHDPGLVLLDEPFAGLDRASGERLAARIESLRREQRTVVLVTHDLPRAAALADVAVVLFAGRIAAELRAGEVSADALEQAYGRAGEAA